MYLGKIKLSEQITPLWISVSSSVTWEQARIEQNHQGQSEVRLCGLLSDWTDSEMAISMQYTTGKVSLLWREWVSRFRQKIRSKFNAVPRSVFAEVMGSCDDGCPSRSIWNKSRNLGAFRYTPIADCGLPQRGDSLTSRKAAALVEYNCQQQPLI